MDNLTGHVFEPISIPNVFFNSLELVNTLKKCLGWLQMQSTDRPTAHPASSSVFSALTLTEWCRQMAADMAALKHHNAAAVG